MKRLWRRFRLSLEWIFAPLTSMDQLSDRVTNLETELFAMRQEMAKLQRREPIREVEGRRVIKALTGTRFRELAEQETENAAG